MVPKTPIIVVVLAPILSGCTLIGAGIGALRPAYSYEDVTGVPGLPDRGDTVEIVSKRGKTRGRYDGVVKTEVCDRPPTGDATCARYTIAVDTKQGRVLLPAEEVTRVSRRYEDGTKLVRGAIIGAVIDVTIVAFVLYLNASGAAITNLN